MAIIAKDSLIATTVFWAMSFKGSISGRIGLYENFMFIVDRR